MRVLSWVLFQWLIPGLVAQTDWPVFGHAI